MNSLLFKIIMLALAAATYAPVAVNAQVTAQQGYSTQLLRDPVFDPARVTVETIAINNWLVSNYKTLSAKDMKGPREHLYYLIDSRVKEIYAATGQILPAQQDPILETLFSWSERLHVYGGAIIYNRLRSDKSPEMRPLLKLPPDISISLEQDLLSVKAENENARWSVKVPYYFMITTAADWTANNGMRTQVVTFSTGTAKDSSAPGYSQGTLMLVFSPGADAKAFSDFWRSNMRLPDAHSRKPLSVRGLEAQYHLDRQKMLHTEFVSWSAKQGPFAVAYLGNDGTYQKNRQHFIDFLNQLRID